MAKAQALLLNIIQPKATDASHVRPVVPVPLPRYPLGQISTQLPLSRYFEARHTVHVVAEVQVLQFELHALLRMSSHMLDRHTSIEAVSHLRNTRKWASIRVRWVGVHGSLRTCMQGTQHQMRRMSDILW